MSSLRISNSEARASAAELAMTNPARPFLLKADCRRSVSRGNWRCPPWEAQGKRDFSEVIFETVFVDPVNIEGRIGEDKIELARTVVQVFVIGVALSDVASQSVDGKVHLVEADGFSHPFLTIDADFR